MSGRRPTASGSRRASPRASRAEPDDQPLVAGRQIADGRADGEVLRQARRGHDLHAASDAVAVRSRADGPDRSQFSRLPPSFRSTTALLPDVADHDVDVAVVVEVAERGAAAGPCLLKDVAGIDSHEAAGLVPQQQRRLQVPQVGRRSSRSCPSRVPARRRCPSSRRCRSRRSACSSRRTAASRRRRRSRWSRPGSCRRRSAGTACSARWTDR